jgi:hypothetical protein
MINRASFMYCVLALKNVEYWHIDPYYKLLEASV